MVQLNGSMESFVHATAAALAATTAQCTNGTASMAASMMEHTQELVLLEKARSQEQQEYTRAGVKALQEDLKAFKNISTSKTDDVAQQVLLVTYIS